MPDVGGYIMTNPKYITLLFLLIVFSCRQDQKDEKPNPLAVRLNYEAMKMTPFISNSDSTNKAISLLNKATLIDSNYFLGYYNKLIFYSELKQFNNADKTVQKLIKLRPNAHDIYLTAGIIKEQLGDTINAQFYFTKSFDICNKVLDTMSNLNKDYKMLIDNKIWLSTKLRQISHLTK